MVQIVCAIHGANCLQHMVQIVCAAYGAIVCAAHGAIVCAAYGANCLHGKWCKLSVRHVAQMLCAAYCAGQEMSWSSRRQCRAASACDFWTTRCV